MPSRKIVPGARFGIQASGIGQFSPYNLYFLHNNCWRTPPFKINQRQTWRSTIESFYFFACLYVGLQKFYNLRLQNLWFDCKILNVRFLIKKAYFSIYFLCSHFEICGSNLSTHRHFFFFAVFFSFYNPKLYFRTISYHWTWLVYFSLNSLINYMYTFDVFLTMPIC